MTDILDRLVKAVEQGEWPVIPVIIVCAVLFKLRTISDYIERRERRKVDFVKEALEMQAVDMVTREFAVEELNSLIFKKVTGITAGKALRERLMDVVGRSGGEVRIESLSRARSHLELREGKLAIRITDADKVEWLFNWGFAICMAIFAMLFLLAPGLMRGWPLLQIFLVAVMGLALFFFALFLASQTIPFAAATKLRPLVEKLEKEAAGPSVGDASAAAFNLRGR